MNAAEPKKLSVRLFVAVMIVVAIATALVTALLVNIFERKKDAPSPFVRLVEVTEEDLDPAQWVPAWPRHYDS